MAQYDVPDNRAPKRTILTVLPTHSEIFSTMTREGTCPHLRMKASRRLVCNRKHLRFLLPDHPIKNARFLAACGERALSILSNQFPHRENGPPGRFQVL
jgi:hypothetical protein